MNNCNKRSGAGKKSLPRTHNTDKVATVLLKDQMTAVDGEVEVEFFLHLLLVISGLF
jgi:hypothetical protein